VPVGGPPTGTGSASKGEKKGVAAKKAESAAIPSGQWPAGTGGSPVPPGITFTAPVSADGQAEGWSSRRGEDGARRSGAEEFPFFQADSAYFPAGRNARETWISNDE